MNTVRARVINADYSDRIELHVLVDKWQDGRCQVFALESDGVLHPVEEGCYGKPYFSYPARMGAEGRALLSAIGKAIREWEGEPTQDKLAGKLEATERHLADMRLIAGMDPSFVFTRRPR